jgi:hypothetical protein
MLLTFMNISEKEEDSESVEGQNVPSGTGFSSSKSLDNKNIKEKKELTGFISLEDFKAQIEVTPVDKRYSEIAKEGLNSKLFDADKSSYTHLLLDKLVEKGILEDYDTGKQYQEIDQDLLVHLSSLDIPFFINDDNDICYRIPKSGDAVIVNFTLDASAISKNEIAELLPKVSFNVSQGGIKERRLEAEAIYKIFVVNKIFDGIYTESIKDILKEYDLQKLKSKAKESFEQKNFVTLLLNVQSNSSVALRIILSACNINITNSITKKEAAIYSSLSLEEGQELVDVNLNIAALRSESVKAEKLCIEGWQIAKVRAELKTSIIDIIESSKVKTIYKILGLSSESIPEINRLGIANECRTASYLIKEAEGVKHDSQIRSIERKLRKRAFREFLVTKKAELLKQYRTSGIDFEIQSLR